MNINNQKPPFNLVLRNLLLNRQHWSRQNLVAHWIMNEGGGNILYDASDELNYGTVINEPNWEIGKFGSLLNFDGVDDYVDIGDVVYSNILTVSAWVKTNISTTGDKIYTIVKRDWAQGGGVGDEWALLVINNGNLIFQGWDNIGVIFNINAGTIIQDEWTYIVGVHTGSEAYAYVNGVLVGSDLTTGTIQDTTASINIGHFQNHTTRYYDGIIDNVRIYKRALSVDEVFFLYNNQYPEYNKLKIRFDGADAIITIPLTGLTYKIIDYKNIDYTGLNYEIVTVS